MQLFQNIVLPVRMKAWKEMGMSFVFHQCTTIYNYVYCFSVLIRLASEVAMKAKANLKECSQNMKQCESDLSAAYILLISGTAVDYTHHSLKGQ